MKILDAGSEPIPNNQVLDFIKRKRAQHKREEAEDREDSLKPTPKPSKFLTALDKHESYLASEKFGYKKSPAYYDHEQKGMEAFNIRFDQLIIDPITAKYKRGGEHYDMPKLERVAACEAGETSKELAETEELNLYNTTPVCVEQLQTMVENWEDRYTSEEMDLMMQALQETYLSGGEPADVLEGDRFSVEELDGIVEAMRKGSAVNGLSKLEGRR